MKDNVFSISGFIFAFTLIVVVLNPEMRSHARSIIIPNDRIILALAKASLQAGDEELQVQEPDAVQPGGLRGTPREPLTRRTLPATAIAGQAAEPRSRRGRDFAALLFWS